MTDSGTPAPSMAEQRGLLAIRCANKAIRVVEDVIFILILLIGLWYLADTLYVFYHARAEATLPMKPDGDIDALQRALSEDAVAWITLDDTSIDYPVMQGVDNYAYLNTDPYGDYSLAGSIFLDSRNASDFSDEYSILYGHHMSGGYMFGALDDFAEQSYFETHTTGTLYTERGELPLRVLAFLYTDASNEMIFDPHAEHEGLGSWIKKEATCYNRTVEGDALVALSTCKSPTSTRRMIVFCTIQE